MEETFETFLRELDSSADKHSGKELLEAEVLRVMRKEGFSDIQIYRMALENLLDLFYDAYHWDADEVFSGKKSKCFSKKQKSVKPCIFQINIFMFEGPEVGSQLQFFR